MGREAEDIAVKSGGFRTANTANDHAKIDSPCGFKSISGQYFIVLIAAAAIASRRGASRMIRTDNAQAVFAHSCSVADVIRGIAAADSASLNGRWIKARHATAQAELARP